MTDILDAYLAGGAQPFFGSHPSDPAARRAAVRRAARPLSPAVADALTAQNARLESSSARDAHLAALRRGAAAVVTGQQVGLFLGPLYTIYKAASAVRVARALEAESGLPVVPVFWLQTEDHDLPEIAQIHVPRSHAPPLALRLPSSPDDRVSIAHLSLPGGVAGCLAELRAEIGRLPHAEEHLARLERHYRPGAGWGEAFAGVLAELFAPEGLVLIDPRDAVLGAAAAPIHRRALVASDALSGVLTERAEALESAGFSAPVRIRDGSPLSFFHPEGPSGPRHRLAPVDGAFAEVGGPRTHSREDLLAALEADPLSFSTSALLRPILQDSLLPTAAYVGGPGEVAYFAQLPPLYSAFDLAMPLIVPRARFRVIEPGTRRLLAKLRLDPDDAALGEEALLARCLTSDPSLPEPSGIARALMAPFDATLESLAPAFSKAGPDLDRAVRRTRGGVERAVSRLSARYAKARLHRDQQLVEDVRRLERLLHPDGGPQERCYGISYFAARRGERGFLDMVFASLLPFDSTLRDLHA